MMADVSLIFNSQAQILRVVQDANRNYSLGRFKTNEATAQYITSALSNFSPQLTADTALANGIITSTVRVPAMDLTATKLLSAITTVNMEITSQHLMETSD